MISRLRPRLRSVFLALTSATLLAAPFGLASPPSQVGGLAAALREWRGRRRVSQLELALRAGTTQRHVSFIESGAPSPAGPWWCAWPSRWRSRSGNATPCCWRRGTRPPIRRRTSATPAIQQAVGSSEAGVTAEVTRQVAAERFHDHQPQAAGDHCTS